MARKILHISLIITLAIATTGISISKHFCGDRLVEVSVNEKTSPCCGTESNCCQTETDFFQLDDDFTQAVTAERSFSTEYNHDFSTVIDHFSTNDITILSTQKSSSDSSPPPAKIHDLSLHQTYLL